MAATQKHFFHRYITGRQKVRNTNFFFYGFETPDYYITSQTRSHTQKDLFTFLTSLISNLIHIYQQTSPY